MRAQSWVSIAVIVFVGWTLGPAIVAGVVASFRDPAPWITVGYVLLGACAARMLTLLWSVRP